MRGLLRGRSTTSILALGLVACGRPAALPDLPETWVGSPNEMHFILVHPGTFEMGLRKPPEDVRPAPPHTVRLSQPYYLSQHEVTQEEWEWVMGTTPSQAETCGPECPVESVTWWNVAEFLERLSDLNPGEVFRLPTEAEWENACRAGGDGRYGDEVDTLSVELANYDPSILFEGRQGGASRGTPVPVGSFAPNAWGFHDLVGNVWEWVADEYCPYPSEVTADPLQSCGTDTIPIRGGSWYFSAGAARCGRRYTHDRDDSGFSIGFRVVREVRGARETT